MANVSGDVGTIKEKLSELIVECLNSGSKLPTEKEMMERFGVSRTTLRDALGAYEASGVIVSQQGSGRYVRIPDLGTQLTDTWSMFIRARPTMLVELLEIRSILEISTLPTVFNKITIEDLQALRLQVLEMKAKVAQGQGFSKNDREFHRILFSTVDNQLLSQLLAAFWDLYEEAQIDTFHEGMPELAEQHQSILDAIVRKDLPQCTELLRDQFADAQYRIIVSLMEPKACKNAG